jgi:hypothetical protein
MPHNNNMATKAMCMALKVSGSLLDVSLWASSGPPERLIRSVGIRYNEHTRCLKNNIEEYSTLKNTQHLSAENDTDLEQSNTKWKKS